MLKGIQITCNKNHKKYCVEQWMYVTKENAVIFNALFNVAVIHNFTIQQKSLETGNLRWKQASCVAPQNVI